MAEDWTAAARDVDAGMREAGQLLTISGPGAPTYDPANGATTPGAPTSETTFGVTESYSAFSIDEDKVRTGDLKLLVSPLQSSGAPLAPPIADKHKATLASDPRPWRVVHVDPTEPAGVPVLYTLQLRR